MVLPKPYIDCRYTGVFSQPNFFKKVEIRGCAVGSFPVIYIERATKYATRSLGSAGEHRLHTAGVTGSNPVATTTNDKAGIKWFRPFSFKWMAAGSLQEMSHASNASKPAFCRTSHILRKRCRGVSRKRSHRNNQACSSTVEQGTHNPGSQFRIRAGPPKHSRPGLRSVGLFFSSFQVLGSGAVRW